MTDQLDAVARALANAIWGGTAEEDAFDLLSPGEQDTYRGWAQAAIDALGLTEEWRCIGWVSTSTEKTAWLQRQSNGGEVQARLVSPWVRKDSSDE